MIPTLHATDLVALIRRVFAPDSDDRRILVMVDLPDARTPDSRAWRERREMAAGWAAALAGAERELGLATTFAVFPNVGANNADLPGRLWPVAPAALPADASALDAAGGVPVDELLATHSIVLAPTEFSATAPLKLLARRIPFRAATMGGFSADMLPALRLDFAEVRRRVGALKALLDRAESARLEFVVDERDRDVLVLDLRHRTAHASDGILDRRGMAGNLPSGEAYIVPYEGERDGDPSGSSGTLPVEFDGEVVRFRVEANVAVRAEGSGPRAADQAEWLAREPAYGNMAELGLGVLADLGVRPVGAILLDEKLGLHVAFGRSDHFGGQVGASRFSRPEAVVHVDRVYLPSLQPRIRVARVALAMPDGGEVVLMRDGRYEDVFGAA